MKSVYKKIEDIAWELFQTSIKVNWVNLTREEFPNYEDYDYWMEQANKIYNSPKINSFETKVAGDENLIYNATAVVVIDKNGITKTKYIYHIPEEKGKYPMYDIPASGKPNWMNGAFTLCFVYSKYNGNFIIHGYHKEVTEFLKENFTHYFCHYSFWSDGKSRGYWKFWKDNNVTILSPSPRSKYMRSYKYKIYKRDDDHQTIKEFKFKRMPHRWIPEFDQL